MSGNYNRGPPNIDGMYSLKVDNLTYRTSSDELRRTFEKYGEVGDVYIPRDRHTRESRGFAFVRFFEKRDAEDAMDSMDGHKLDGREIKCQMARYGRPTEPHRSDRRGGGGRWGGGGGGGGNRRGSYRSRSRSPRSPRRSRRSRERSYSRSKSRSRSYSRSRSRDNRSRSPDQNGADVSD